MAESLDLGNPVLLGFRQSFVTSDRYFFKDVHDNLICMLSGPLGYRYIRVVGFILVSPETFLWVTPGQPDVTIFRRADQA